MKPVCPEKPELLEGQPLGQYHCPYCGMMVVAGIEHPPFINYEAEEWEDFLGERMPNGWYAILIDYSYLGPFNSEEEAVTEWLKRMKEYFNIDWEKIHGDKKN